jgi:hypothetical protein
MARGYGEGPYVEYLKVHKFKKRFSRADGKPGNTTDTCSLESSHRHFKDVGMFEQLAGCGQVCEHALEVGARMARHQTPLAIVPPVGQKVWMSAQTLVRKGWQNLGFKMNNTYVFPSEKLLDDLPPSEDTIDKKRAYIKTWAQEYIGMRRSPTGDRVPEAGGDGRRGVGALSAGACEYAGHPIGDEGCVIRRPK